MFRFLRSTRGSVFSRPPPTIRPYQRYQHSLPASSLHVPISGGAIDNTAVPSDKSSEHSPQDFKADLSTKSSESAKPPKRKYRKSEQLKQKLLARRLEREANQRKQIDERALLLQSGKRPYTRSEEAIERSANNKLEKGAERKRQARLKAIEKTLAALETKAQQLERELKEEAKRLKREAQKRERDQAKEARRLEIIDEKEWKRSRQEAKEAANAERKALELKQRQKRKLRTKYGRRITPDDYPEDASAYLQWAFAEKSRPGWKADQRRINVVSQELADDVVERLIPSLEKHKGCDIIDINPGTGIFSATLHDHLKPRSHIFLEPDQSLYNPFLHPLISAPDSKYTLIPKSGIVWRQLEDVLTKSNLPHQEAYARGDPRLEQPNNTLLVIANLGFYPKRAYRGFGSVTQLVIHQFMSSVRSHSLFQQYGLVRMLIWVGSTDADKVLPKSIQQRRKSCIEAEIACDVREIALSPSSKNARDISLEMASTAEVVKQMEDASVRIPPGRESDNILQLREILAGTNNKHLLGKKFMTDLEDLEARFSRGEFKKTLDGSDPENELNGDDLYSEYSAPGIQWTPEYSLLRLYRRHHKYGRSIPYDILQLRNEYLSLTGMERAWFLSKDEEQRAQLMQDITRKREVLQEAMEDHREKGGEGFTLLADNTQALELDPPLLHWDRRKEEPLKTYPSEFFPEQEMTLLDFQPQPLWPILRKNYPENYETFEFILSQLMVSSKGSIKKGLQSLAPGAYEWMIENCPSLTDPTKGGALDPSELRVRMLTTEMLRQMIEAWMEWPFRPNRYELIHRCGSAIFEQDAMDEDQGANPGM